MPEEQQKKLDQLTFEEAMAKLERIVGEMERGGVPLEDMIAKFEEGAATASFCQKKLASLKQKMEILLQEKDGTPVWREMTPSETEAK